MDRYILCKRPIIYIYIQEILVQLIWVKMANLTIFYMHLVNQEMCIHV